jgi:hypothetical protein
MQKIFKQRFEQIFSDIKVIEALSSNDSVSLDISITGKNNP